MGNQCSEQNSTKIIDSQFGDINHSFNTTGNTYDTVFYTFSSFKLANLEKIENHWAAIKELKTDHIVKPSAITYDNSKILLIPHYKLTIEFAKYDRDLEEYARDFLKLNPLIPEINIVNVLAELIEGLFLLLEEGIKHGNISPQTIFMDYNSHWILATPNVKIVNLSLRIKEQNHVLNYLIPPELVSEETYDPFESDLYSLGVTILHVINPFDENLLKSCLLESDIQKSFEELRPYYSKNLLKLLKEMTLADKTQRITLRKAFEFINMLRDL
jgi:serine/threonine protein kinase